MKVNVHNGLSTDAVNLQYIYHRKSQHGGLPLGHRCASIVERIILRVSMFDLVPVLLGIQSRFCGCQKPVCTYMIMRKLTKIKDTGEIDINRPLELS